MTQNDMNKIMTKAQETSVWMLGSKCVTLYQLSKILNGIIQGKELNEIDTKE